MAYLTTKDVQDLLQRRLIQENRGTFKLAGDAGTVEQADVFLAHVSADWESYVKAARQLFAEHHATTWTDKTSVDLHTLLLPVRAARIRNQIGHCRRFVYVVTPNSIDSKWTPWELGFADAAKGNDPRKVAILPMGIDAGEMEDWKAREYLKLYPCIQTIDLTPFGGGTPYIVQDPDPSQWDLIENWLRSSMDSQE